MSAEEGTDLVTTITSELAYSSSMFGIDQDALTRMNTVRAQFCLKVLWRTVLDIL